LRIVSGKAKGRKLEAVPGDSTRPILDRVKTALFDKIRPVIQDISILDLFAGSGSVGIEALSQGARFCTFIDINKKAVETVKKNLNVSGLEAQAEILNLDAFTYLKKTKKVFDLIFIAPPQYKSLWTEALHYIAERPEIVKEGGNLIVQIDPKEYEAAAMNEFKEVEQRKYGSTLLVFYEKV
jgi:16S rRNA (guanine966-N2)-methyltransferase